MRLAVALLIVSLTFGGCAEEDAGAPLAEPQPDVGPDPLLLAHLETLAAFPELRFETDRGTIRIVLYADWTPQTVQHIGGLADAGFYDGTLIHRVVDDFVIQGGDPTGTGEGGSGPLGLSTNTVPLEVHEGLQFGSGAVGLARWTEDTGDSQWFITEKPAPHLDDPQGLPNELLGPYSLFGQVFEGMYVVRTIAAVATLPNDRPVEDVALVHAKLLPPPEGIDLIGLVHEVAVYDFDGLYSVELPRWAVAGHAIGLVVVMVRDEEAPCEDWDLADIGIAWIDGDFRVNTTLQANAVDACTLHSTVVLPAGEFEVSAYGNADIEPIGAVKVLSWHDAYLPFTGTLMNEA